MPNTHSTLRGLFSDIADAIREKDGSSGTIVADTFPDAIRAIPTGGGGEAVEAKDVNFFDYDGTILYSYTKPEFAALTAMPDNPSHDGLTAQGWNWALANAKSYVNTHGKLNIGQMYITDDGKTRIYVHLKDNRLTPILAVCPNGTVTVDWGDGSATTTLTGTSVSTAKKTSAHTYVAPGDYVITLSVSGSMGLLGASGETNGSYLLRYSTSTNNRNFSYRNAIWKVEIGDGVTTLGNSSFGNCNSLESVTVPTSVTSMAANVFGYCYNLKFVAIPSSVTSIGNSAFNYCHSIMTIAIPSSVTSIGTGVFTKCYCLESVTIPSSVSKISGSMFSYCYCLSSITIPSSATSIETQVVLNCYGMASIKFTRTTPPTVSSSSAWSNLPTDCVLYVPRSALSAYTSATNYPSSSTYTYVGY